MLAAEVDVTTKAVQYWVAEDFAKRVAPNEINFDALVRKAFALTDAGWFGDKWTVEERHECRRLLVQAWERARGIPGLPPKPANSASAPFPFPKNLPAEMDARREVIRDAVASLLKLGSNSAGTGPLDPLRRGWPDNVFAAPDEAGLKTEAEDLFIGLTSAIRRCNATLPPWADNAAAPKQASPAASDANAHGERRRRDCYSLAMLLSAMVWTAKAWTALPHIGTGKKPTLEQVRDPRLLHAGIEASQSKIFELPHTRRALAEQQRRAAADWPPVEAWHMVCHGSISRGVGIDHHEEVLARLAALFGLAMPTRAKHHANDDYSALLAELEQELAAEIRIRGKESGGRSFGLAEKFEHDQDPGVAELYRYANLLSCRPLAYDGKDTQYVRGDERSILVAINNCLDAIASIP